MKILGLKNQLIGFVVLVLLSILFYKIAPKSMEGREIYIPILFGGLFVLQVFIGVKIFVLNKDNIKVYTVTNMFSGGEMYMLRNITKLRIGQVGGRAAHNDVEIVSGAHIKRYYTYLSNRDLNKLIAHVREWNVTVEKI